MVSRQQQSLVGSAIIIAGAIVLVAVQFTSDLYSPVLFIFKAASPMLILVLLLGSVIYSSIKRTKTLVISTLAAALISLPFCLPKFDGNSVDKSQRPYNKNAQESSGLAPLTVATFSTLTRTNNVDDIVNLIEQETPDVLCLQELSAPHRATLFNRLQTRYPYRLENNGNQLTLSTYPLHIELDIGPVQSSILTHPQWGPVKVINTHMPRPYLNRGPAKTWQTLFDQLEGDKTLILCGDLNTTPNNSLYELLYRRYALKDSLTSGYGFTFPNAERRSALFGPLIRIDYILTRGMDSLNTRTINASNLSDHRAVITQLWLTE